MRKMIFPAVVAVAGLALLSVAACETSSTGNPAVDSKEAPTALPADATTTIPTDPMSSANDPASQPSAPQTKEDPASKLN